MKLGLVVNDTHDPFIDPWLWEQVCHVAADIKPDVFVRNGDSFDFYQISKFPKNPARRKNMGKERDIFVVRDEEMMDALPDECEKKVGPGNHEARLHKYLWELMSKESELLDVFDVEEAPTWWRFLKFHERGYKVYDFDEEQYPMIRLGKLRIMHGHKVRVHSAYTARGTLEDIGKSVMVGHTHRGGKHYKTDIETTYGAFENFCLCSKYVAVEYKKTAANWQQGFSLVSFDEKSGWFNVEDIVVSQVPKRRRKQFIVFGKLYSCKDPARPQKVYDFSSSSSGS